MTNHDILLSSANSRPDMERGPVDEESFRKMAEEMKRPHPAGVSLFRQSTTPQSSTSLVKGDVRNGAFKPLKLAPPNPDRVWESLSKIALDEVWLAGNGVFTNPTQNPACSYFDILRTKILQAMQDRGWQRIAVTSPTHGCGKSFVATNLAFSLARRPSSRNVLIDLELRGPNLAKILGLADVGSLEDFLLGEQPLESHFCRLGQTLAFGLNDRPVIEAAELLHEPSTSEALDAMMAQLDPQIVVYDAPPVLVTDDVLALLPKVDAVLLVIDGTRTTAEEVRACERLLEGRCPLMGVVLNRAQDRDLGRYRYGHK
ncbi:MAG: Mrp family chromosome partitioning ATPase [Pseudorhodobacter sp.]|jgi:protein-tyrosine kinase